VAVGDDQAFSGAGGVRYAPAVIVGADHTGWLWTATAGGRFQEASAASLTASEVFAGAGAGVHGGPLQLGSELTFWGAAARAPALDVRGRSGGELLLTARYALGPFTLGAGAGPGFGRLPGTPRFRLFAALGVATDLAPPPRPAAPPAPPPRPPGATDGDDAKRAAHAAPPASDLDGDSVPDAEDACPRVVGEAEPPPGAQRGFRRGCPRDRDEDGIRDIDDRCPEVPGIASAAPEKNGCPPDADGDEIADADDACPNERGKPSVNRATNGCPVAVRLEGEQIVILQQVQFATGKAEIEKGSFELLSEVAAVLQEHPEIARLAVDGHTDDAGPPLDNLSLSQRRALAVVQWLTSRGVDARRLEARGFGPRRPIANNRTAAGRAQNRRVEFQIRKRTEQGAAGWKEGPLD
jgi:OmpA-OmpF porin, OOP family